MFPHVWQHVNVWLNIKLPDQGWGRDDPGQSSHAATSLEDQLWSVIFLVTIDEDPSPSVFLMACCQHLPGPGRDLPWWKMEHFNCTTAGLRKFHQPVVLSIWRFPKMGVARKHPSFLRIFHYKPSSYWGSSISGNPQVLASRLVSGWVTRTHGELASYHQHFPLKQLREVGRISSSNAWILWGATGFPSSTQTWQLTIL